MHKKYNALVLVAFNNDSGFVAALDKACGRFINSNSVTRAANSSSKSPELLAKYCDLLLKKSSKNPEEAELEDTLNQVSILMINFIYFFAQILLWRNCINYIYYFSLQMVVFKYIEDKDVFQKFYSKMLAKRLVQHMSYGLYPYTCDICYYLIFLCKRNYFDELFAKISLLFISLDIYYGIYII